MDHEARRQFLLRTAVTGKLNFTQLHRRPQLELLTSYDFPSYISESIEGHYLAGDQQLPNYSTMNYHLFTYMFNAIGALGRIRKFLYEFINQLKPFHNNFPIE